MAIGLTTGVCVAGFESAVNPTIDLVVDQPVWVVALVPALGLIVVNLLGVAWNDVDAATTDAYVRAYHHRDGRLRLSSMWRKVIGSAVTLGTANTFGFEGPSMLIGGTIGSSVEGRFASRVRRDDAKVLMVAGAAAVSVVFLQGRVPAAFVLALYVAPLSYAGVILVGAIGSATALALAGSLHLLPVAVEPAAPEEPTTPAAVP